MQPKKAFYPCCSLDIEEPMSILAGLVDEIYFCDIKTTPSKIIKQHKESDPKTIFLYGDAREQITQLENIDILFYRRDSEGEGGSRLFVLGDSFLPHILNKFNPTGGFIITDGSNSRGGIFKKMMRKSGLRKYGWHIHQVEQQPLHEEHGLFMFKVEPDNET